MTQMNRFILCALSFSLIHAAVEYNGTIYPVENVCLAILDRLSDASAAFLDCAVKRARPVRLCEGCVDAYARLQNLIQLLDRTFSDSHTRITCKQFLESYDSIQIVARIITFVEGIWSVSMCDNCVADFNDTNGTVIYHLTDDTVEFRHRKELLDLCIFNVTQRLIPIFPVDINITANSTVCDACSKYYENMNDLYYKITGKTSKGVCMDTVDTMNYTRLLWSKNFSCQRHDPDFVAVLGVSLFIPTVAVVFYVSAMFKGERKEKKLASQKRLSRQRTTAARVGAQNWLWSNPRD